MSFFSNCPPAWGRNKCHSKSHHKSKSCHSRSHHKSKSCHSKQW